jgi:exopolysaccharide production protein ExoQ
MPRRGPLRILPWVAGAGVVAVALAWSASFNVTVAIGVAVAAAAIAAVVADPASLLLILVTSIFTELVSVGGTAISRVLAPIALLTVFAQLIRGRATLRLDRPFFWAGAYAIWALASGLWTVSVSGTLFQLGSLTIALVYMLSFASLVESRRDLERVLMTLAVVSLILSILSFKYTAQALHFRLVLQEGRSQGLVGDPNAFAAVQLVVLPLVIVLAAEVKARWLQLALYGTVFIIIGSILTSLSRGALVGLAVLLILLLLVPFRLVFRSRRSKLLSLAIVAAGALALSLQYSSQLTERVGPLFQKNNIAAQEGSGRLELWKAARASVGRHPWLGLGYGGFVAQSEALLLDTPGVDLSHYSLRTRGQPVHNVYLGSFADLGLVGLVLYLGLVVSTGQSLRRTARKSREAGQPFVGRVAGALLLGLVTWAVISVFVSTETSRAFWIVVGLSLALPKLLASEPPITSRGVAREATTP